MSIYKTYIETTNHEINYHYLNRYIKFITHYLNNKDLTVDAVNTHHILPKCLFPEFTNLKKYKWNSINLTFKQHRVAHFLLAYAFPKTNLRCALRFFCVDKISGTNWYNDGQKNYRLPKSLSSGFFAGRLSVEAWKNKTFVSKDGKNKQIHINQLSEYLKLGYKKYLIKEKIFIVTDGNTNTGIIESELSTFLLDYPNFKLGCTLKSERRKLGAAKTFHKGDLECRVMVHEEETFIAAGWVLGRSPKSKKSCKHAAHQINKDGVNKRVNDSDLQTYLNEGWEKGLPVNKNHNKHVTGTKIMNKCGVNKRVCINELQLYLDQGWNIGTDKTKYKKMNTENLGKTYKIQNKNGNIIIVKNIKKFLVDNNLSRKAFKNIGVPYELKYNDSRSSSAAKNSVGWCLLEVLPTK